MNKVIVVKKGNHSFPIGTTGYIEGSVTFHHNEHPKDIATAYMVRRDLYFKWSYRKIPEYQIMLEEQILKV